MWGVCTSIHHSLFIVRLDQAVSCILLHATYAPANPPEGLSVLQGHLEASQGFFLASCVCREGCKPSDNVSRSVHWASHVGSTMSSQSTRQACLEVKCVQFYTPVQGDHEAADLDRTGDGQGLLGSPPRAEGHVASHLGSPAWRPYGPTRRQP